MRNQNFKMPKPSSKRNLFLCRGVAFFSWKKFKEKKIRRDIQFMNKN